MCSSETDANGRYKTNSKGVVKDGGELPQVTYLRLKTATEVNLLLEDKKISPQSVKKIIDQLMTDPRFSCDLDNRINQFTTDGKFLFSSVNLKLYLMTFNKFHPSHK